MADLSSIDKMKFEKLFDMDSGYVIDFSNKTFSEFILENTGFEIYNSRYDYASGSKANRLRAFWQKESNQVVGQLLLQLLERWRTKKEISFSQITPPEQALYDDCIKIAERLANNSLNSTNGVTINSADISVTAINKIVNIIYNRAHNGEFINPIRSNRKLRVFLCHASNDKPTVENYYNILVKDGFEAWLDKKNLVPGQDWQIEIPKAVRNSDVVVVFLSSLSVNKEGFIQKEIRTALDIADEKPEGTIFIIPARLEDCHVPGRLAKFQWVDLFENDGYERLFKALQLRANSLDIVIDPKASALPK